MKLFSIGLYLYQQYDAYFLFDVDTVSSQTDETLFEFFIIELVVLVFVKVIEGGSQFFHLIFADTDGISH